MPSCSDAATEATRARDASATAKLLKAGLDLPASICHIVGLRQAVRQLPLGDRIDMGCVRSHMESLFGMLGFGMLGFGEAAAAAAGPPRRRPRSAFGSESCVANA